MLTYLDSAVFNVALILVITARAVKRGKVGIDHENRLKCSINSEHYYTIP
jgi:hypothetical protein